MIYISGFSGSVITNDCQSDDDGTESSIDRWTQLKYDGITDVEIAWNYLLVWKDDNLHIAGKLLANKQCSTPLRIPGKQNIKFKQAIPGSEHITVLTNECDIWIFNIIRNSWRRVPDFISKSDEVEKEYVVKIVQGRCTVALTNLGHVFNIPILLNADPVKFIDAACGFDHTILLAENGDIYSVGMGTRGQLGHGDLEDCDEPKLIEALAGLRTIQISAGGWHSAVITDQGDVYSWGWNNQGQLGHPSIENVVAIPKLVDFMDETKEVIETNINKVECGNAFTICRTDANEFWGCGSNKYGQLGTNRKEFPLFKQFVKLDLSDIHGSIENFKCREWSTCLYMR